VNARGRGGDGGGGVLQPLSNSRIDRAHGQGQQACTRSLARAGGCSWCLCVTDVPQGRKVQG
jgi:hypothetical protein